MKPRGWCATCGALVELDYVANPARFAVGGVLDVVSPEWFCVSHFPVREKRDGVATSWGPSPCAGGRRAPEAVKHGR